MEGEMKVIRGDVVGKEEEKQGQKSEELRP
jgi:hypothetical protein